MAADEAVCADGVTALRMPDGLAEADVRAIARAESGVMLSGGQAPSRPRSAKIPFMHRV